MILVYIFSWKDTERTTTLYMGTRIRMKNKKTILKNILVASFFLTPSVYIPTIYRPCTDSCCTYNIIYDYIPSATVVYKGDMCPVCVYVYCRGGATWKFRRWLLQPGVIWIGRWTKANAAPLPHFYTACARVQTETTTTK